MNTPKKKPRYVLWGVLGFLGFAVLASLTGRSKSSQPVAAEPEATVVEETAAPIETAAPAPTPTEEVDKSPQSAKEAFAAARPMMRDHEGDGPSLPASALSVWLGKFDAKDTWAELKSMPDNALGEAMKDPDGFRGQKVCVRGTVIEIVAIRSAGPLVWIGGMTTSTGVVRFLGTGSSKGVTAGKQARFCGVFFGLHTYSTQIGGKMTGAELVGVFDLPENR